jgi:EAL domain-containing protein (putative c-di-GMP-specific phosphodiesterase class I)
MRRVNLLLKLSGSLTIALCLGWLIYYVLHGMWAMVPVPVVMCLAGGACYALVGRDKAYAAGTVLLLTMYVMICIVCLVVDVPSAQVPRSAHHFLLPMAAGAAMVLRGGRPWVRHFIVLLFLSTFVLLGSTNVAFQTPYALSDDVRTIGSVIDSTVSALALFMVLYVMQAEVEARNAFEADLGHAVIEGQFVLHYQPQVNAAGLLSGVEALVRWQHPRRGLVAPGEFIELAERNGLILQLGDWVLKQACTHLAEWAKHPATASLTMAVNVSARQFRQPDFVAQVLSIVERSGIRPHLLKLELTESMLVNNIDDIIAKMQALKAHGIGFSLDDFGTGYSSLSYLRKMPLDQLKIDQAFVRDLHSNAKDQAIARTVIDLGQNLQLAVIAEGVETAAQRDALAQMGCPAFQGYLYGKPMPEDALRALALQAHEAAQAAGALTPRART